MVVAQSFSWHEPAGSMRKAASGPQRTWSWLNRLMDVAGLWLGEAVSARAKSSWPLASASHAKIAIVYVWPGTSESGASMFAVNS